MEKNEAGEEETVSKEVEAYDWFVHHTTQLNGWCNQEKLFEWLTEIWWPLVANIPKPKLLLIDSYPLHCDLLELFTRFNT